MSAELFERRKQRNRYRLNKHNKGKLPRLRVFRSHQHIYAQLIDDLSGVTVVAASSIEKECRDQNVKGSTVVGAKHVGQLIAERASKAGVTKVVFDRGGYLFHGRVKALADAAREGGLQI